MADFIRELTEEHKVLLDMLEGFKRGQGITGKEWKEKLFAAKELFIEHLKKEDESLYPELLSASELDPDLEKTVQEFIDDMRRISAMTLAFLDKYHENSGGTAFIRDFAELEINLKKRISQEEMVLYPQYTPRN